MFTTEQSNEIVKRRHEIVVAYCTEKGWSTNPSELKIEQIMEIRKQQKWKDIPTLVSEGK